MSEIAIIGAGPAGIAASIYLQRAGLEPLVFEKGEIGGLLLNANLVENYPGFPEGIGGKELVQLFKKQLSRLKVRVNKEEVKNVSREGGRFQLSIGKTKIYVQAVIIASGTLPKSIELKGQSNLLGKKFFYEIKDIPTHNREAAFVVIGGGDAAFDYALNLSSKAARVDIIFRSEKPKCLSLLEERVITTRNINLYPKTVPSAVEEKENRLIIQCSSEGKKLSFSSDYSLIACGRTPNLGLLSEELQKESRINEDGTTNIPGLYLAGDVRRGLFRQTGIAIGDGILCAMMALDYLRGAEKK